MKIMEGECGDKTMKFCGDFSQGFECGVPVCRGFLSVILMWSSCVSCVGRMGCIYRGAWRLLEEEFVKKSDLSMGEERGERRRMMGSWDLILYIYIFLFY